MKGALRSFTGFTIVEVMIALAVSGAILVAGISVLSGRNSDTQFDQAVYDLQSKFQSYISQVSSKSIPGYQQYTCKNVDNMPTLTQLSGPAGDETTGGDCIYLGQAVEVIKGGNTIYAYPVLGLSTIPGSNPPTYPTDPVSAHQEPAMNNPEATSVPPLTFYLVDTYPLLNGLTVDTAFISGGPGVEKDMLALYSDLQSSNTSGNEISATSSTMTFGTTDVPTSTNISSLKRIQTCIEQNGACTSSTDLSSKTWLLCVTNGTRYAQLAVRGTPTGISITPNLSITNKSTCEGS